jgi:hypothetical protein
MEKKINGSYALNHLKYVKNGIVLLKKYWVILVILLLKLKLLEKSRKKSFYINCLLLNAMKIGIIINWVRIGIVNVQKERSNHLLMSILI